MYINKMCSYMIKSENKCHKIFRPWDCVTNSVDSSQDSTISTTTVEYVQEPKEFCDMKKTCSEIAKPEDGFKPLHNVTVGLESPQGPAVRANNSHNEYLLDSSAVYADLLHPNMIQPLEITPVPADPLFFESMAQGFALEEYARVLNQEHQAKLLAAKKQRPKKYKCPHCEVGFSNNGQLKGHIRIHTGERPFKCDEKDCGKTFTRNEELTRHKRIHSGLRPFPCTHCGKRFGRKDHLKKHSRTHFQPRGLYAVPVMLPYDTWASGSTSYPFIPMLGY